jgi:hypothetical protein
MQAAGSRDETVDEEVVVYRTQRIKHFDREGCEYWAEVRMPDIEIRKVACRVTTYSCPNCGASRDERTTIADGTATGDVLAGPGGKP